MFSVSKKVLHMDRNKYYGGESASISPLEDVSTVCVHFTILHFTETFSYAHLSSFRPEINKKIDSLMAPIGPPPLKQTFYL
jgi:RAB protein geranylgeranyltransferase component A